MIAYTVLGVNTMRLSAKVIKNYANINNFDYSDVWTHRKGDENTLYFQLVDLDKNGQRYLAGIAAAASVQVIFPSIDDETKLTLNAAQVDPNDASIWKIDLAATDLPSSGNVQFAVTEGATIRRFGVLGLMSVEYPDNDGSC
jgi:hypothetical protein